jgi:predicted RNA-binding protein with PIN domain
MSAAYLIDGYNLLYAMGVLGGRVGPHGLEKARARLLGLLHGTFAEESPAVTVVFDAAQARPGAKPEHEHCGLRVVYAVGSKEADDVIEQLIRRSSAPKSLHVISDDRRVQQAGRRRHCVVRGCEAFLRWLGRRRWQKRQAAEQPEKREALSEQETNGWLAEFRDLEKDPSLKGAFERFDFEEDEST